MTARVVISLLARSDTVEIVTGLAHEAGYRVAAEYAAKFETLYDRLSEYPESGAPRPKLGPRVRIGVVLPYVVFYETSAGATEVAILRILHGSRSITWRMLRP